MKMLSFDKLQLWTDAAFYVLSVIGFILVEISFMFLFGVELWKCYQGKFSIFSIMLTIILWAVVTVILFALMIWSKKQCQKKTPVLPPIKK